MALNVVLYEPEIPANTGNIGRTCMATGTRLHLIEPLGFRLGEKELRRAGMDYWDQLDVILHDNKETSMRIPMLPGTRSLNLSNSVAIVVYEALRQNGFSNMELTGHLRNYDWD